MAKLFELPEFEPYARQWQVRTDELLRRRSYYDGSVYKQTMNLMSGSLRARMEQRIRPLYLPLARAVDTDVGIIPGGWAWPDSDDMEGVTEADIDRWAAARRQVFDWSGWRTEGVLYVHYGAETGVSVLRVSDLREAGQVQLAPVDPATVMLVENGQYDIVPRMAFVLQTRMLNGEMAEYAEVITPETVRTYADGLPVSIDGRPSEYPNELGFVPFVEIEHKKTGRPLGECTYQIAIPMLDEVNAIATDLAKNIKQHGDPQWVVIGAEASNLVHSGDNVWFISNPQGDAKPVVAQIDISGALAFIEAVASNMEASLPELAFDELKGKDQIATATIELQLMELVLKIMRCRPNYDQGLIDALRLCGRAAAGMGGLGDIAVLDDERLAFDADRPVLPQDRLDQIRVEEAELALEMQRHMASGEGMTNELIGDVE